MDKTSIDHTICPRSNDPFYIVIYYIKWVTTSWTHSIKYADFSLCLYREIFSLVLIYKSLISDWIHRMWKVALFSWDIRYSKRYNILVNDDYGSSQTIDAGLQETSGLLDFRFSFYGAGATVKILYVKEVMTQPKIFNRTILSNLIHVT